MAKERGILNLSETMKEIRKEVRLGDKPLYNFFKAEIKPKLAYTDNSPIQTKANEPKRKYVGGWWKVVSSQVPKPWIPMPWVRIGVSDIIVPSLELIVSDHLKEIPRIDLAVDKLGGIGYGFEMGVEYTYRSPGLMVENVVKEVDMEEYEELLNIANKFHKKFESYIPNKKC
jgi:hypothetical protein